MTPESASGAEGLWGYVRLIPREGATPPRAGGGSYGDRRMRDVRLVDYDRPGFAVVYAEGLPASPAPVVLTVREGVATPHIEPALAALGAGAPLRIHNASRVAHAVSLPSLGRLETLAPGTTLELEAPAGGEHRIFLLDAPRSEARVFVAPGLHTVPSEDGRFALGPVAPGRVRLVAWHPRFPSTARWVDVGAGTLRVDLELGVSRTEEARP